MAIPSLDRIGSLLWTLFAYGIKVTQWLAFYSPHTCLLLHRPILTYFIVLAQRHSELSHGRRHSMRADNQATSLETGVPTYSQLVIYLVILSPLCYLYLSQYRFLPARLTEATIKIDPPTDEVLEDLLRTDPDVGLSENEAMARREAYGPNEIDMPKHWVCHLLSMVIWKAGPPTLGLEIGAIVAAYLGDWMPLTALFGLLVLDIGVRVYQTKQAGDVVASVLPDQKMMADTLRQGQRRRINAKELVIGDIIYLERRTTIPADCRVLSQERGFAVDQSAITGESRAMAKPRGDMCYCATGVVTGNAVARVEATVPFSFIGRTISLVEGPQTSKRKIKSASSAVSMNDPMHMIQSVGIAFGLVALTTIANIIIRPESLASSYSALELCVALVIATLPDTVHSRLTTIRAQGAAVLSDRGAIVQSIADVELLAGVDVMCVDKTGTLTQNVLQTLAPYCHSGTAKELILTAALASAVFSANDPEALDPIDRAIAQASKDYKIELTSYRLIQFHPFEPVSDVIRSRVMTPAGDEMTCVLGSPKAIYNLCSLEADDYIEAARAFARRGWRALGVACRREGQDWEVLGLLPMDDPPQEDTLAAIREAERSGVSVMMMTGDAVTIANEVAKGMSLRGDALHADVLLDDSLDDSERSKRCAEASAFAELSSTLKVDIVRELQKAGHTVAITGECTDDAPSLEAADVGIAVKAASEKAQAASDVVFLIGGFAAHLRALQICRQIFELLYNFLLSRISLSLHLCVLVLWEYFAYSSVFDPMLLLLVLHCYEITDQSTREEALGPGSPAKPRRWKMASFWMAIVPLAIILSAGGMVSLRTCATQDVSTAHLRQQIMFLHAVLTTSLLQLLMRTNGQVWTESQRWRSAALVLLVGTLTTASCILGLAIPGSSLNARLALDVWRSSLGTICTAAGFIALTSVAKRGMIEAVDTGDKGHSDSDGEHSDSD